MHRAWFVIALLSPCIVLAQAGSRQAAEAAYERKENAACGEMFRRLASESKNASLLYSAACCFALAGNKDAAFATLDEIMRGGWPNTKLLREDTDLQALHDDQRWTGVLAQSEANWTKKFGDVNRELWAIREADDATGKGRWTSIRMRYSSEITNVSRG